MKSYLTALLSLGALAAFAQLPPVNTLPPVKSQVTGLPEHFDLYLAEAERIMASLKF